MIPFRCPESARRVACCLVAFGVLGGVCAALRIKQEGEGLLPNVDADGNIDIENTSPGTIHQIVNTKNIKLRSVGEGTVENLSEDDQKYKNSPELEAELLEGDVLASVKKTLYKVKASGAAKLTISAEVNPELIP